MRSILYACSFLINLLHTRCPATRSVYCTNSFENGGKVRCCAGTRHSAWPAHSIHKSLIFVSVLFVLFVDRTVFFFVASILFSIREQFRNGGGRGVHQVLNQYFLYHSYSI